eukprot:scaffold159573_cov21-Tisochrysis_lutea.AAC.1
MACALRAHLDCHQGGLLRAQKPPARAQGVCRGKASGRWEGREGMIQVDACGGQGACMGRGWCRRRACKESHQKPSKPLGIGLNARSEEDCWCAHREGKREGTIDLAEGRHSLTQESGMALQAQLHLNYEGRQCGIKRHT